MIFAHSLQGAGRCQVNHGTSKWLDYMPWSVTYCTLPHLLQCRHIPTTSFGVKGLADHVECWCLLCCGIFSNWVQLHAAWIVVVVLICCRLPLIVWHGLLNNPNFLSTSVRTSSNGYKHLLCCNLCSFALACFNMVLAETFRGSLLNLLNCLACDVCRVVRACKNWQTSPFTNPLLWVVRKLNGLEQSTAMWWWSCSKHGLQPHDWFTNGCKCLFQSHLVSQMWLHTSKDTGEKTMGWNSKAFAHHFLWFLKLHFHFTPNSKEWLICSQLLELFLRIVLWK